MLNRWITSSLSRRSCLNSCWTPRPIWRLASQARAQRPLTISASYVISQAVVGPIIGSAQACQNVARSRVQLIVDKFQAAIREYPRIATPRARRCLAAFRALRRRRPRVGQRRKDPIAKWRSARSPTSNNPSVWRPHHPRRRRSPTPLRPRRPTPQSRRPSLFPRATCAA